MRYVLLHIVSISFCCLIGCTHQPTSSVLGNQESGAVTLSMIATAKSEFASVAARAHAIISALDMDTIKTELLVSDSSVSGSINAIPAGKARNLQVFVFTDSGNIAYYGTTIIDIYAGEISQVPLVLYKTDGTGGVVISGKIVDTIHYPDTIIYPNPSDTGISSDTVDTTESCYPIDTIYVDRERILLRNNCNHIDTLFTWDTLPEPTVCTQLDSVVHGYVLVRRLLCDGIEHFDTVNYSRNPDTCHSAGTTVINRVEYLVSVCGQDTILYPVDTLNPDTSHVECSTAIIWKNYTPMQQITCEGGWSNDTSAIDSFPRFSGGYKLSVWTSSGRDTQFILVGGLWKGKSVKELLALCETVNDSIVLLHSKSLTAIQQSLRRIPSASTLQIVNGPVGYTAVSNIDRIRTIATDLSLVLK